MTVSVWMGLLSSVLLLIGVLSLIGLHLGTSALNPIRDAVSLYIYAPYGAFYRLQAIVTGIGALCLVGGLLMQGGGLPLLGVLLLGLYGVARVAIAIFPSDPHPPLTHRGMVHLLLGTIMFTAIACTTGLLTWPLSALPLWQGLRVPLLVATILTIVSVALTFAFSTQARVRHLLGLVERGIYLGTFVWMACTLFPLMKH